jgi:hypothetical protein
VSDASGYTLGNSQYVLDTFLKALRIESLREQREMLTLGQSPLAGAQFASWLPRPMVGHDQHRAGESPRVQVDVVIASTEAQTLRAGALFPWGEPGERALE